MKVAICDDEASIVELIEKYIEAYFNDKSIQFECHKYTSGLKLLSEFKQYDIVFLDIEMTDCNGIEIAREINKLDKNTLVFIVTAYHNYLDDAMDQNVFRYIDKPIDPKRLYKGLEKAIERIEDSELVFKTLDYVTMKIQKSDLIFVEILNRNTVVHTISGDYVTNSKIEYFRNALPSSSFAVPHNSYIINLNHVVKYNRTSVLMRNGSEIVISQKKQPEFKKKFLDAMRKD